jgi:serine/threonine protein kinase
MDPLVLILLLLIVLIAAAVVTLFSLLVRRPASHSATHPLASTPRAELVIVKDAQAGQHFPFRSSEIRIGHDPSCDVHLDEPLASPFHATVRFVGSGYTLVDTGSSNGTWINEQRVWQADIPLGTRFQIGGTVLALVDAGQDPNSVQPPPAAAAASAVIRTPPGYNLEQRFDKGGQATVYRATRIADSAPVVVKYLNNMPYDVGGRYFRAKFEQQILIGASIRHPHCVQIYGGDATADPPYLIEEYLAGGSLRERMRKHALSDVEATHVLGQVCDALSYLHRRGIVHRDISLSNIMFDDGNETRLIDFGLARLASAPTRSDLGLKVGVALYMSPEQAKGNSSLITPQSDLYSLGTVAYELFTGHPPFQGNDLEILSHQLKTIPPTPAQVNSRVPPSISATIMRALEKDPRKRFRNAEEMARAFGYTAAFNPGDVDVSRVATIKGNTAWKGDVVRPIRLQNTASGKYVPVNANPMLLTREQINRDDHAMSRRHGQLYFRDNFWWIAELPDSASANGIYHNDVQVVEPHIITLGDTIRLGSTYLKVVD